MTPTSKHIWSAIFGGVASVALNGSQIWAHMHAVSPTGNMRELWSFMWVVFLLLAVFGLCILSLLLLIPRSTRSVSRLLLSFCVAYLSLAIPSFIVSGNVTRNIRTRAFHALATRSSSIVQAIRLYEQKQGHPPFMLDDLVPEFIPTIPSTGMGAYPHYEYVSGTNALSWDGNPWVLYVKTPLGGINWDMFMYFPMQNYPKRGYGGSLEIIEEWAYVHE